MLLNKLVKSKETYVEEIMHAVESQHHIKFLIRSISFEILLTLKSCFPLPLIIVKHHVIVDFFLWPVSNVQLIRLYII